jgi:hypothetical protein
LGFFGHNSDYYGNITIQWHFCKQKSLEVVLFQFRGFMLLHRCQFVAMRILVTCQLRSAPAQSSSKINSACFFDFIPQFAGSADKEATGEFARCAESCTTSQAMDRICIGIASLKSHWFDAPNSQKAPPPLLLSNGADNLLASESLG